MGFEDIHKYIDADFEILDEQYDKILQEYRYIEHELSKKQWEEMEKRFVLIDEEYEEILEEFEFDISESRERQLEDKLLMLDLQYNAILRVQICSSSIFRV